MIGTADVQKILTPEIPKITSAEYVNAKKWQEVNGYSAYTPEAILIKEYEAQQAEDRAPLHDTPMHQQLADRLRKELGNKSPI